MVSASWRAHPCHHALHALALVASSFVSSSMSHAVAFRVMCWRCGATVLVLAVFSGLCVMTTCTLTPVLPLCHPAVQSATPPDTLESVLHETIDALYELSQVVDDFADADQEKLYSRV